VALRGWKSLIDYRLLLLGSFSVGVATLWYWRALYISTHYEPYHFFGYSSLSLITLEQLCCGHQSIGSRTSVTFTSLVLVMAAVGVVSSIHTESKIRHLFTSWLAGGLIFSAIAATGHRHDWYRLPIAPAAAALAGSAFAYI
jgi:hypothetical protein